jgi:hypothetical protein
MFMKVLDQDRLQGKPEGGKDGQPNATGISALCRHVNVMG